MASKNILNSVKLPTLSKTLYEMIELEKRNPVSILKDIKCIIEKDPLLSAQILKVANSPLYGFSQKVRTISHAISLLGVRKIRSIAFAFSIFDFIKKIKYQPKFGKTFNLILKKSLLNSAIATILAQRLEHVNSEELYLSGLLSDIGQLLLFLYSPEEYRNIHSLFDEELIPEEKKLFNTDHVQVGAEFCRRWNLPDFIVTVINSHSRLESDDHYSKIAFISNQLVELILSESDEETKKRYENNTGLKSRITIKELENNTKKLLRLSFTEVEEAIKNLPNIMEAYVDDFPELQKDLNKLIETGSSLIISLMKEEMDIVIQAHELSDTQKKLAEEKIFLAHMLNLSYFLSSLMPHQKIISSLFEYFEKYITDLTIEFIYKIPGDEHCLLLMGKDEDPNMARALRIDDFYSLVKAKISNEAVRLSEEEMEKLEKKSSTVSLVFPISYHHNLFGFLLLNVENERYNNFDLEMSYIQILVNIVANSFQNYHSFQNLKKEINKKEMVTQELLKFDKQLDYSKKNLLELQKNEIIGEMLPIIFHKLKNKLTPVLGYSQILMTSIKDESALKRLQKIERNANELTEQLNLLRDYFTFEGQPKEKENLNNILHNLKRYFYEIEFEENIEINLALDFDVPMDALIPGQIEALIINCVDNACQAVKAKDVEKKTILITTDSDSNSYTLKIRDNGIGIRESDVPMIWVPFYSQFKGKAGLGLTICEKILANHEATRSVETVLGEFTEFTFTFKPKTEELHQIEESLAVKKPEKTVFGKILIVDDEAFLLDLMEEILLNEGDFEIVTTTSGPEALKMLDGSYNLVISDIRMPEVSGMDIFQAMKEMNMESKIIMVTGDPFSEDVAEFLKKNHLEYLKKPFELMDFKRRVMEKLA